MKKITKDRKVPSGNFRKKCFFIMRLTLFFLITSTLSLLASGSYSQNTRVSLNLKSVSVKDALKAIENSSEFFFIYNNELIDVNRKVDITVKDQKISDILSKIFDAKDVEITVVDRKIILAPTSMGEQQQGKKVSGKVTDSKGSSLPGVSVILKGTTTGVMTDNNGSYSLSNVFENAILQFSFVGMESQEILVSGKAILNVTLTEETVGLAEVMVVGYGTIKKRDVSTSISSVSSEELKNRPLTNFAMGISGLMPGVVVQNTNSAPGGGQTITIRGVSSLNASNSPLYVVDGFAMPDGFNYLESPINSISPSDIESIEVLKDASSSAIYGTRAANGVILITTKKGKSGKPKINFSYSTGVQSSLDKVKMLSGKDFLQYMGESRDNAYILQDPNNGNDNPNAALWSRTDPTNVRIANWDKSPTSDGFHQMYLANSLFNRWISLTDTLSHSPYNTDWQNVLLRHGKIRDYQISLNGGTENVKYYMSGGYYKNDGLDQVSGYERFSLRTNLEANVTKWLKVGLTLNPTLENTSVLANSTSSNSTTNPFLATLGLPPTLSPYLSNGTPDPFDVSINSPWGWNFYGNENPLLSIKRQDKRKTIKVFSALNAEVKFMKDLIWKTDLQSQYQRWDRSYFSPSIIPQAGLGYTSPSQSAGTAQGNDRLYTSLTSVLTYMKTFKSHSLTAMVGMSVESTAYSSFGITKYDFPTDVLTTLNQAITIKSQTDVTTNKSSESMMGTFGRLMYNYSSKYYLTASVRRDASSKFGSNNRWGVFPSLSAAWRISDEKFFKPLRFIANDVKLRGGWGIVGNAGISNYLFSPSLSASTYLMGANGATASFVNSGMPNANLSWETSKESGIGADFQFLNNRIGFTIDYYYRLTDNMLYNLPLLSITGFSGTMTNIGSMRNRGFEYQLNTRNLTGEFKWSTNFNLSYNRSLVLSLSGLPTDNIIAGNNRTAVGKPLDVMYGGLFLGPYKNWEDVKTSPIMGSTTATWKTRSNPGDPKFADINGDGIIDASDQTVLGRTDPDYIFGIGNTFEYKGFDLTIHFNGWVGGLINAQNMTGLFTLGNGTQNVSQDYFDNYWRPDNTNAKYAMPSRKSFAGNIASGMAVFSATRYTIDNFVFGYTFGNKLLNKAHLGSLRMYLNIQNLYQWKVYPGYNVENTTSSASATSSQGSNTGSYPTPRTVSFGINLGL